MNFLDGALHPENQDKLVITASPYGPEWLPSDFPEDIAVSMDDQVQKAVDCYNAGATVLHVHVREADGKGSKRLSKFNELLARLRVAVPDMVLQVGGSISFAPESVRYGQDYAPGAALLLQYLISQAQIPEYQVRWRWQPKNSFAFWDNRSTQHYAVMDYPPCHRKMERAGIKGDTPR